MNFYKNGGSTMQMMLGMPHQTRETKKGETTANKSKSPMSWFKKMRNTETQPTKTVESKTLSQKLMTRMANAVKPEPFVANGMPCVIGGVKYPCYRTKPGQRLFGPGGVFKTQYNKNGQCVNCGRGKEGVGCRCGQ